MLSGLDNRAGDWLFFCALSGGGAVNGNHPLRENSVRIKERKRDGIAIIELSGKLMGGPDAESFDEILKTLIHEGIKNFVVNLEKVRWVNSTGLGILISGYTTVKKSGGELKLLKVSDRIENIFIVSKLYTVFDSYDDENEAVQSFS